MDESDLESGSGVNFIPCIRWVKRGVAKRQPEKVKLTQAELAAIIEETQGNLKDLEEKENGENEEEEEEEDGEGEEEEGTENEMGSKASGKEDDFEKEYDMENYDNDEANNALFGIGELVSHADQRKDPYLKNPDLDDDESDVEDIEIKATDNLILVGHVEGNASVLEVYVYNDVEDALYVHHDILLPSFPLALEWLSYDPGEEVKGSLCAIGSMNPIIEVWDLDVIDSLEPAFVLGQKGSKKKKVKRVGHKDAVLSLAWNHHVEHVLASGSVDQSVLLWDLSQGTVASRISSHEEKVQSLQWHPFEAQTLATGCCDEKMRVFDCRAENSFRSWKVEGEVEKVLWNHFNPFTCLVSTEKGFIHMVDVRQESKPLWTLQAHSGGINGLSISTQCPDCIVSVSSDKTMKVWDIADNKPNCVLEKNLGLGQLHTMDNCPDAPFVVAFGGDKAQDNLKIMDIREYASVRDAFGDRALKNPLGAPEFGYPNLNKFEEAKRVEEEKVNGEKMEMEEAMEAMTVEGEERHGQKGETGVEGGAAGKFRKKDKKKKKKNKNF